MRSPDKKQDKGKMLPAKGGRTQDRILFATEQKV